jgi:hypothetical protein
LEEMLAGNTVQLSFLLACAWNRSGGIWEK